MVANGLRRLAPRQAGTVLAWSLLVLSCGTVGAQQSDEAARTPDRRQALYEELAREVAALERQGNLLKKVIRLVKPTVVHIEARKPHSGGGRVSRELPEEAGSGVIVELSDQPYVLTNRHVVRGSPLKEIDVRLADGRLVHPSNLWSDRETDVAVMAVPLDDPVVARLGNSREVEIGDFVLAVGSPFGLSHSVTYGIISAKGRRDLELGDGSIKLQDFLQTDAAINPGNSGGPLLNLRGELIGLNTAIASSSGGSEGIGFAIPINMAITVAKQLVEDGHRRRAYLGVQLNPAFGSTEASRLGMSRPHGALVSAVTPDSPADNAEFQKDDVVLQFDGYPIEDDDHLIQVVGLTPVGTQVEVVVLRNGKRVTLMTEVADRSRFEPR